MGHWLECHKALQQRRQALLAELGRAFWHLPALRLAALGEAPGRSLSAALARGLHLVAGSLAHLELEAPQLATLDWVASAHAAPARCYCALPCCADLSRDSSCRRSCLNCNVIQALQLAKQWRVGHASGLQASLKTWPWMCPLSCCRTSCSSILVRLGHMWAGVPLLTCLSLRGCHALAGDALWALRSCPCLAALDLSGLRQLVGPTNAEHVLGDHCCAATCWLV